MNTIAGATSAATKRRRDLRNEPRGGPSEPTTLTVAGSVDESCSVTQPVV